MNPPSFNADDRAFVRRIFAPGEGLWTEGQPVNNKLMEEATRMHPRFHELYEDLVRNNMDAEDPRKKATNTIRKCILSKT